MSFVRTSAINKILSMKARKKVIQGGSSASKTYGILSVLIDKATKNPNLEISVISESVPHLKKGAVKDFKKIMKWTGRWNENHWHDTDRKYTFANGAYIEFFSPEAVLGARRDVLYINEANNITYENYHQLSIRTAQEIYIDFNPSDEFWAHTEVLTEQDSELLILTYRDNEALPPNVVNDFLQAQQKANKEKLLGITGYWTNWCKVYIDGEIGSLQGVVFQFELVDEIPPDAKRISYGMDWGFTNDPTGFLDVYRFNQALYLDELIYQTGLTNSDIINKLIELKISKREDIIADSAEPKSIEDLRRAGYSVYPSKKGEDSIRNSIDTLQGFKLYVTRRSLNLIKEFRMYRWDTGKDGKSSGKPIDAYNHLIDPLRYVALNKIRRDDKFDYMVG